MNKIESKIGKLEYKDEQIYTFLADFNNFEDLIPEERVSDWSSDGESCSFRVEGLGNAGLKFVEKQPFELLKISSDDTTPLSFMMWIQLKALSENQTAVKITIEPEISVIMMGMVKKPLKDFVDMLVDQMSTLKF